MNDWNLFKLVETERSAPKCTHPMGTNEVIKESIENLMLSKKIQIKAWRPVGIMVGTNWHFF